MGGVHFHVNEEVHEKSKANVIRYCEQIEGKRAVLRTWEERGADTLDREHEYITGLKARIRKATVLLSHIKP